MTILGHPDGYAYDDGTAESSESDSAVAEESGHGESGHGEAQPARLLAEAWAGSARRLLPAADATSRRGLALAGTMQF